MPRPDIASPEGRKAYAKELGMVARPLRWSGLAALALAAFGILWTRRHELPVFQSPEGLASLGVLVLGWVLIGLGISQRTAYHRRRMAEK